MELLGKLRREQIGLLMWGLARESFAYSLLSLKT